MLQRLRAKAEFVVSDYVLASAIYHGERALARAASRLGAGNREPAGLRASAWKMLAPGPHGEYPSATAELWYFSRRRWESVFRKAGFEVEEYDTNRIFYTGYGLFPSLEPSFRRPLAHFLGASCHIFVLRPAP